MDRSIDVSRKRRNYLIGIIVVSVLLVLVLAYFLWLIALPVDMGTPPYLSFIFWENPYAVLNTIMAILGSGCFYVLLPLILARSVLPKQSTSQPNLKYKKGIIFASISIGWYVLWFIILTIITNNPQIHQYAYWLENIGLYFIFCYGRPGLPIVLSIVHYLFTLPAAVSLVLLPILLVRRSESFLEKQEAKKQQALTTTTQTTSSSVGITPKNRMTAFLLCFFLGDFGAHRFYVGRTKSAVLWLLTLGLFNVGSFVDLIMILTGSFRDVQGNLLIEWDPTSSKSSVSPPSSLSSLASSPSPPPPPSVDASGSDVVFCFKCGGENPSEQQFCGKCGERLVSSTPTR